MVLWLAESWLLSYLVFSCLEVSESKSQRYSLSHSAFSFWTKFIFWFFFFSFRSKLLQLGFTYWRIGRNRQNGCIRSTSLRQVPQLLNQRNWLIVHVLRVIELDIFFFKWSYHLSNKVGSCNPYWLTVSLLLSGVMVTVRWIIGDSHHSLD